jgi:hypothetical protein
MGGSINNVEYANPDDVRRLKGKWFKSCGSGITSLGTMSKLGDL